MIIDTPLNIAYDDDMNPHTAINDLIDDNADLINACRELLILSLRDEPINYAEFADLDASDRRKLLIIRDLINSLNRAQLTDICLAFSLCPLHRIDYAICFDDDDADCAQIRIIHPDHD